MLILIGVLSAGAEILAAADFDDTPETRTGRFQIFNVKIGTWVEFGHRLEALSKRIGEPLSPGTIARFRKGLADESKADAEAKEAKKNGKKPPPPPEPPKGDPKPDYEVYVSPSYSPAVPAGLIVWEGGGEDVVLPAGWEQVMDDRNILWIGPHGTGNEQDVLWRAYQALESVRHMKNHFAIDNERVYICGISGGGRMASRMGVMAADTFAGFFSDVGADFYTAYWPKPDPAILHRAKTHTRGVLLEGGTDFNLQGTKMSYQMMKQDGFLHISFLLNPNMGHEYPNLEWFNKSMDALEEPIMTADEKVYKNAAAFEVRHQPGEAYEAYVNAASRGGSRPFVKDAAAQAAAIYKEFQARVDAVKQTIADGKLDQATTDARKLKANFGPMATAPFANLIKQINDARKAAK